MKKKSTSENIENEKSLQEAFEIPTLNVTCTNEENAISMLDELVEIEKQLLVEKRQIIGNLAKWQSMFDSVSDKRSRIMKIMEQNFSSKQQNDEEPKQQNGETDLDYKLFSVVTWGPSWDGLVFTVMAENDAWAEELVREWLNSNGRENHKIDKIMALVSRDVRAIVNVGAKLLDV
jgi:hypothetical protein